MKCVPHPRLFGWFVLGFILLIHGAFQTAYAATITVATMNLFHDFPAHQKVDFRLDMLASEIKKKSIDIVGVQEGYGYAPSKKNTVEALAKKLGYYYVFSKLTGPGKFFGLGFVTGNGIISRYPITESGSIQLDGQSALRRVFENRCALRATIETPSGPIQFFTAHLAGKPHRSHTLQARSLGNWIQGFPMNTPAFLAGDFNAEDHAEGIVELQTVYHMIDAEKEAHPMHLDATSCREIFQGSLNPLGHCPRGSGLNRRVDYVFVVPSVQGLGRVVSTEPLALEGQIDPRDGKEVFASDHVGVASVVEW